MQFSYVIGRHVSDFKQFAGLSAQLLLSAGLMEENVSLFVSLATSLFQFRSRHREIVFSAVELLRRGLISIKYFYFRENDAT